ncbi:hypothetical protein ACLRDC_07285 [Gluconacetobacter sacchari]|uniref:hypothetical protein n=1 Tax=Gluconacetobacter sacchari TaxID=92759 RepID=UPI0039B65FE5
MYAAAGPAQIETGQGRHVLPRGRAAWIPAGTRHRSLVSDHVGASLYFSPEAVTDPSTHVTNSGREPADARNGPARDALGNVAPARPIPSPTASCASLPCSAANGWQRPTSAIPRSAPSRKPSPGSSANARPGSGKIT